MRFFLSTTLVAMLLVVAGCSSTPAEEVPTTGMSSGVLTEEDYVAIVVDVLCLSIDMAEASIEELDAATEEIFAQYGADIDSFNTLQDELQADPAAAERLQPAVLGRMSEQCPAVLEGIDVAPVAE